MSKSAGTSSSHKSRSSSADRPASAARCVAARAVAARVLARVWQDQAYAAPALDAELRDAEVDPREARLATELVYGVLRTHGALERSIDAHVKRRGYRRKPLVRAHLLVAAYTIFHLDRIPAYAAVDEAVGAIRAVADRRVAAFANAVLRKLAQARQDEPSRYDLKRAVLESVPSWLRGALDETLGAGEAERCLTAGPIPPPLGICLRQGRQRSEWLERLRAAAPEALIDRGRVSPRCLCVRGAGDLRQLPGAGTDWLVQEEGAQLVALAVGARLGETVLDACSGRGGKALLLAEQVGPRGAVDAADRLVAKLELLRASPAPGASVRNTFAVDWSQGSGQVPAGYDRLLVDAPCSGTGTLRRRPEIALRLTASDVARLAALQVQITRAVAGRARPGARLFYAVCSVLRQETDEVVAELIRSTAGGPAALEPCPFDAEPVRALARDGSTLRLLPHEHGTDGYFVASFVVRQVL